MANLKDVAKAAGVSIATVSRVLNNSESVRRETKMKVQKAIKTLNFKPNRVAQRLRVRNAQRDMIGLLIPDIRNPFYVEVIRGVEDIAYSRGFAVMMGNFAQDESKEKMLLGVMRSEAIDGLIVAPASSNDEDVVNLVKSGIPLVCVDRGLTNIDSDTVLVDNEKGAFEAVELLINLGHQRIAYIAGIPQIPSSQERYQGYIKALTKYGIDTDNDLVRFGDSKHESGKRLTGQLLDLETPPTALFTGNNLITLGALEMIQSRGINIPKDIAIIGFDDMYWSQSLNPPLTAVKQPAYEIGRRAAELLFNRIAEPDRQPVKLILKTELIKRNSC